MTDNFNAWQRAKGYEPTVQMDGDEVLVDSLVGRRVRLVHTDDQYTTLEPGTLGRVTFVDDMGTVHVRWDDSSTLGMVAAAGDRFELVVALVHVGVEPGPGGTAVYTRCDTCGARTPFATKAEAERHQAEHRLHCPGLP